MKKQNFNHIKFVQSVKDLFFGANKIGFIMEKKGMENLKLV